MQYLLALHFEYMYMLCLSCRPGRMATISYGNRRLVQGGEEEDATKKLVRRQTSVPNRKNRPFSDASLEILEGYEVSNCPPLVAAHERSYRQIHPCKQQTNKNSKRTRQTNNKNTCKHMYSHVYRPVSLLMAVHSHVRIMY